MRLTQAKIIAARVMGMLEPACERIEVAGSVRRMNPDPNDVEIVALPVMLQDFDMFGQPRPLSMLEVAIREHLLAGYLELDRIVKRNGPKAKRFVVEGISIDLFIADRDNYGDTMAIRTGDSDFSHALVTERRYGGLMPSYLKHHDGYLWRGPERIPCPTEADFFRELGVRIVEPQFRNASVVRELAKHTAESKS